jgi:dipeptidyl aminopeptidase/acylaminoacyl peptidase
LLANRSLDNRIWLVWSLQSDQPYNAYLLHRDRRELEHLFSSQPDLEQYEFVPKRAVDFAARDYEQLHGY